MTVMWIDDNWELHEVLLDFIELEGSHTGENMAKYMLDSLIDMDIVETVSTWCTKMYCMNVLTIVSSSSQ
jgi:hypothetical protein